MNDTQSQSPFNPSGASVCFSGCANAAPIYIPTPQEQYHQKLDAWQEQVAAAQATIEPDLPWWKRLFVSPPQLPPAPSEWNPPQLVGYCTRTRWQIASNGERVSDQVTYAIYRETNGKDGNSRYYYAGRGKKVYIDGPAYEVYKKIIPLK